MRKLLGLAAFGCWASAQQPNPPVWPDSVRVFSPEDDESVVREAVQSAFAQNGGHIPRNHGEFSEARFAFLFKPGTYHTDVPVGYYTQVIGLGKMPADVVFDGPKGVYCEEGDQTDHGGALTTFWRMAENFHRKGNMLWAASQAAPVRRAVIDGELDLAQFVAAVGMGYSSGGFLGNVQVTGKVNSGSQQQFCSRNSDVNKWPQGNWNMAFIGVVGAPPSHCGSRGGFPSVNVPNTPVIAEKPFISWDPSSGRYYLNKPGVNYGRSGVDWSPGEAIDFEKVYVATAADSAQKINSFLASGLHVVLSPGIYQIDETLELQYDGQVLLGLGLATLVSNNGVICVHVRSSVRGGRVAGLLLQAGSVQSPALLVWGDGIAEGGSADDPGFMHDIFARVGGTNDPKQVEMRTNVMLHIAGNHVIGDNFWLWRADHCIAGQVAHEHNPVVHGLVVTGDYVTMYGLAVEHVLQDQVQWYGNYGQTYFFQSELPYDVTQAFGDAGYVGYRVSDRVSSHDARGLGIYHFFRDNHVTVKRGIAAPSWLLNTFESPMAVYLTGLGTMEHIINDYGDRTGAGSQAKWSCEKKPEALVQLVDEEPPATPQVPGAPRPPFSPTEPGWPVWMPWPSAPGTSPASWVIVCLLLAGMCTSIAVYAVRLRWKKTLKRLEENLASPSASGSTFSRYQRREGSAQGQASLQSSPLRRLMGGSSPTQAIRGFFGDLSPTGDRDIARTISMGGSSPAPDRSPVWRFYQDP